MSFNKPMIHEALFTHAHLILDGQREYLDGAIAIKDGKILEVYTQSGRILNSVKHFPRYSLKGHVLLPGYIGIIDATDDRETLLKKGMTSYILRVSSLHDIPLELPHEDGCLGLLLTQSFFETDEDYMPLLNTRDDILAFECNHDEKISSLLRQKGCKALNTGSCFERPYDGFSHIESYAPLSLYQNDGLLTVFAQKERYREVNDLTCQKEALKLLKEFTYKDALAYVGHDYPTFYGLWREMGGTLRHYSATVSGNVQHFYAQQAFCGSLQRGFDADLLVLKEDGEALFAVQKGKLIYD